ncbi:hypothetical protein DVH24_033970 [Malus domestica]|uniref:Uncharacterized protein n=1 Tax=Malus domestica TaxID=3750 RepID=A0A498KWQ2_MALDO|nr:hypothetical protein DVH24_033970 [Malus domestica]
MGLIQESFLGMNGVLRNTTFLNTLNKEKKERAIHQPEKSIQINSKGKIASPYREIPDGGQKVSLEFLLIENSLKTNDSLKSRIWNPKEPRTSSNSSEEKKKVDQPIFKPSLDLKDYKLGNNDNFIDHLAKRLSSIKLLEPNVSVITETQIADLEKQFAESTLDPQDLKGQLCQLRLNSSDSEESKNEVAILEDKEIFTSSTDASITELEDPLEKREVLKKKYLDLAKEKEKPEPSEKQAIEAYRFKTIVDRITGKKIAKKEPTLFEMQHEINVTKYEIKGLKHRVQSSNSIISCLKKKFEIKAIELKLKANRIPLALPLNLKSRPTNTVEEELHMFVLLINSENTLTPKVVSLGVASGESDIKLLFE